MFYILELVEDVIVKTKKELLEAKETIKLNGSATTGQTVRRSSLKALRSSTHCKDLRQSSIGAERSLSSCGSARYHLVQTKRHINIVDATLISNMERNEKYFENSEQVSCVGRVFFP